MGVRNRCGHATVRHAPPLASATAAALAALLAFGFASATALASFRRPGLEPAHGFGAIGDVAHVHDDREPPDSGACLSRELPRARFGEVLVASISELSAGLPAKTFCFHAE